MKMQRWCALAIAIGSLMFAAESSAARLEDTAQAIAGMTPNAKPEEGVARSYAQEVSTFWNEYERRIGTSVRQWACQELSEAEGVTVFYPFSGPDLPWAFRLYPDASRYVLVALEKAEAPPRLESFSREETESYLATFRKAWRFYGSEGYFKTNDLVAETQAKGTRLGTTAPLMAFAVRLGFEIEAIEPIQLDLNTSELMRRNASSITDDTWDSVRLTLRKDGRQVVVDYVRMDLSDNLLAREPGARRWIERMAGNPTLLKAASHHPQEPAFSVFRDSVVANAPSVVQDETGISYSALTPQFDVRLYGKFTRPNSGFNQDLQRGLAAAYRSSVVVKSLPFRLGYEKDSGAALQVASRNNAESPRKCALPYQPRPGERTMRAKR